MQKLLKRYPKAFGATAVVACAAVLLLSRVLPSSIVVAVCQILVIAWLVGMAFVCLKTIAMLFGK
ncbi:MAG: hypothetical protein IT428_10115 [Planctomycetaceae bacterium]|nr:hypothetical protein [Planctomycetaceae bacterium]